MPQFLVRTYAAKGGTRVVVDGIGELDVADPARVEAEAEATIVGYLRSLLPPRPMPLVGPECTRTFGFDVELRRTDDGLLPPSGVPAHRTGRRGGGKGFGASSPDRGPGAT